MDTASSRAIAHVNSSWAIPQLREALAAAIDGYGPALGVGRVSTTNIPQESRYSDLALVVATSGSTGNPKEVALGASALLASARATHAYIGARAGDVWSLLLPTDHIAGMNVITRSILLGSEIADVNSAARFSAIVPTQLHRALHGDTQLLEHLKRTEAILVGGAPLTADLRKLATNQGLNIITTYGMSESCGGCVYNGEPLDGVEISIIDGRIAIKGPTLAIGYLGSDSPFLSDGWFITSDRGDVIDGKLTVEGRADDVIISGGEKISLGTITDFLNQEFPHQEFIAFALTSAEWGESLAIASDKEMNQEEIKSALKERYGAHLSPKLMIVTPELPKTSLGKPDRKKLSEIIGRLRL